jgi:hypothetical protein
MQFIVLLHLIGDLYQPEAYGIECHQLGVTRALMTV